MAAGKLLSRFGKDASGATAIEYGLIAGVISISIVVGLPGIGSELKRLFAYAETALVSAK